ncbi:MAG: hypothetical protein ABI600_01020 [Luteolibacter sp.]
MIQIRQLAFTWIDGESITPRNRSSKVEETPQDDWPAELNRATRRKFVDFSRLATQHPDVMKIVDVLHSAAMRAASQ